MKNTVNPPSALVPQRTYSTTVRLGGNHCVITQTTLHIQAPEPAATPQADQPLIFAGLMICSGI